MLRGLQWRGVCTYAYDPHHVTLHPACFTQDCTTIAGAGSEPALVLLGSAVNQDGRSSSLTAPNGPSQQALLHSAMRSAQLPARKVCTVPALTLPRWVQPGW